MTMRDAPPSAPPIARPRRSLSSSPRVRRTFAYRVNHTLRGDIQTVRAALGSALEQARAASLPVPARDALARLEDAVAHLERRALDIALLTQAESGELELDCQPQRLKWVIEKAVRDYRGMRAMDGVRLKADLTGCGTTKAQLDRKFMLRALGALLHNAIRFSPPGGVVTIHGAPDGAVARITIRDEGRGFAPGDAARVFKPFAAGKHEAAGRGNGLGLGLAVARVVIEAHGGRVWVVEDGEPGGAVAVELPLA